MALSSNQLPEKPSRWAAGGSGVWVWVLGRFHLLWPICLELSTFADRPCKEEMPTGAVSTHLLGNHPSCSPATSASALSSGQTCSHSLLSSLQCFSFSSKSIQCKEVPVNMISGFVLILWSRYIFVLNENNRFFFFFLGKETCSVPLFLKHLPSQSAFHLHTFDGDMHIRNILQFQFFIRARTMEFLGTNTCPIISRVGTGVMKHLTHSKRQVLLTKSSSPWSDYLGEDGTCFLMWKLLIVKQTSNPMF